MRTANVKEVIKIEIKNEDVVEETALCYGIKTEIKEESIDNPEEAAVLMRNIDFIIESELRGENSLNR